MTRIPCCKAVLDANTIHLRVRTDSVAPITKIRQLPYEKQKYAQPKSLYSRSHRQPTP
jgi:hypothetical protein